MDSETKVDISAHCELHCTECRQISSSRSSQMPTENSRGTNCANRSFIGNIFKCRGTYRGLCARTRAAMSKCVQEIKQSVVKYVTSLVRFVKNSAGVLLFCGIIILCLFDLVMLHYLAVHSMEAYAVLLFTPLFIIWLPAFAWKIGCFNLCCGSHERVEDPIPIEMPVEKPPLYETLVFTTPESAMASLPPPSYEVAIQASEIPQILQPDYNSRDANVAASLCPVHQQNSTRHPDITLLI
ncbi:uncharacterized protein LOC124367425 isoform X3 [Homalodisca vitripennis]|uniref:uncharacterized protein LOC124367425 isoform X3 n=1 Tax=Homalodisca vitripennis TaxID=197043 RepID=UPI001EEB17E7|nr:uncharacterized protein LOC124367425 isoform X3 [Homalodisca vitripennis]